MARAGAVHTIAVISRADEIGGGRVDAMFAARGIAQRYRADPTVRGLCQNVVAVAGLIAETGRTLRQTEFAALAALAAEPKADLESQLRSVDRFLRGPDPAGRRRLLERFGIFGIRLSTSLIRQGASSPAALATELVARSGLAELQRVLHTQFTQRRDLLKARSALLAVDSVLRTTQRGGPLRHDIERILAGAHELAELRLLATLRSGQVELPKGGGRRGRTAARRRRRGRRVAGSGWPTTRPPDAAASGGLRRAGPLAAARHEPDVRPGTVDACRVVVRSCEGIVAALPAPARLEPRGPASADPSPTSVARRAVAACLWYIQLRRLPGQHGYQPSSGGATA